MPPTEVVPAQAPVAVKRTQRPQIYFGVAATSLATLILELALTRVFSVIYYYHFAFLAISIALFGLGAGGVFSYVVAGWQGKLFTKLGSLAAANGVAIVLCLAFLLSPAGSSELLAAYFVAAVPFFFSGTVLSLVIAETVADVNRVYFFDLVGAAGGCMALVPLLNHFGGPNTILVSAVLFAVSAAIWFHVARVAVGRVVAVALGLLLVFLITYNGKFLVIDVKVAKNQPIQNEQFVKWNSFSRIALKPDSGMESIVIDGDASTAIAKFDFAHLTQSDIQQLRYQGPGLAYIVRPGAKTLVIGPGGGWDVARALASGSKDITGVEINPIIAKTIMQRVFPAYSNGLYFRPEVKIVIEDGRSFVRRSNDRYQVLQATLVDTWASTAAGAFALSENNLYTWNAFEDYLRHLTPDGVMSFTRWGFVPPRESLRVVALGIKALDELGQHDAASHVIVLREHLNQLQHWGAQDTILISREPFRPEDIGNVKRAAEIGKLQVVYAPGTTNGSAFRDLLLSQDRQAFYAGYPFDVRPVSDNRPFFFYTVQPRDVLHFFLHASRATADFKVNDALPVLFTVIAVSIVAMIVTMFLPPLLLGSKLPKTPGSFSSLAFFLCIGVGYILIQVALIQRFVLFLGHPTYALTVIIFSMLLSSGAGSFFSRRLLEARPVKLRIALIMIAIAITVLAFVLTRVVEGGVALDFWVKVLVSVLLISPAGFLMGMPFPTGLTLLERTLPATVRWAWATNAAASVLGSAAAIFLAIYLGLQVTLVLGGCCYLGAALALTLSPLRGTASRQIAV